MALAYVFVPLGFTPLDPSKDTPKRKAQRDLIQYLETLSPEEITGLVKSDLHHQYWTPS